MDCLGLPGPPLSSSLSLTGTTPLPSHPSQPTPCPSGWNRLPTECIQCVIETLTHDPGALASLLQVNRQLFFLVVPVLYYDPFKTLQDLIQRQNDSIRLCRENAPTENEIMHSISASDMFKYNNLEGDAKAARYEIHGAMAWNMHDWNQRNERMASHLEREISMLATLLWTSIQELCARYPSFKTFYFPPSLQFSGKWTGLQMFISGAGGRMNRRRRPIVNFANYSDRGIVWTSQEYLRHVRVLDLVRISTRQPYKNFHGKEFCSGGLSFKPHENDSCSWEGKAGTFSKVFLPERANNERLATDGALDFLQRALLDKLSGGLVDIPAGVQGAIWSLRIPAHRLRTYQLSQDRAPRLPKKKLGKQAVIDSDGKSSVVPSFEGDLSLNIMGPSTELYQTRKPYGFTLERLKHLRRLEVCGLNNNLQFWETLERVVASLERNREEAPTGGACSQTRDQGMIREFAIEVQGDLQTKYLHEVLSHLKQLEVLEICSSASSVLHGDLWTSDLSWGLNLKSLKIGMQKGSTLYQSFAFLGSFKNLVSLVIMVTEPLVFGWITERKTTRRLRLNQQQQFTLRSSTDARAFVRFGNRRNNDDIDKDDCLPNLRHLSIRNCSRNLFLEPANSAAEAFGDQLEELVLQFKHMDHTIQPIRFLHPLRNLVRLALRGAPLINFFKSKVSVSLAECCPSLEKLALQVGVDSYNARMESLQLDTVVKTLLLITTLECLYFEQSWLFNDTQLLRIASESPRIRKIGCWLLPRMNMEGIGRVNDVLVAKRCGRFLPLKPAGLFRLISRTDIYHEDHWVMSSFDPDRNE